MATPTAFLAPASPILVPTETPLPTPTTMSVQSFYTADGRQITGAPVPAEPQLICTPEAEFFTCYDNLLDMDFRYPAFMGPIDSTMLRTGGYSGFAYEYRFAERESAGGGRSRDFSEGRGPMYTDQEGLKGRTPEDYCAEWAAAFCLQLNPNAILVVMLPQADWLCGDAMMFTPIPRTILILDLPEHPLIGGFGFSSSLMSTEAEKAFREEWYENDKQCEQETKVELAAAMEQLAHDLQAGSAAPELQMRYDAMLHLAESIQTPFAAIPG